MIKKFFIGLGIFVLAIIVFLALDVLPIDRYNYKQKPFYSVMTSRLDSLKKTTSPKEGGHFKVGFAKINITPSQRTALAGYGNRKGHLYTSVHDSIYIRTIIIENGKNRVAIVAADLLIIPPTVTKALEEELPQIGFNLSNTYLSAIHTHNSIGNWGEGVVGFMYGSYSDSIVHFIASKIKESIVKASSNVLNAEIRTAHFPIGKSVRNRINDAGTIDSTMHAIEIERTDKVKLLMMSYTAHATCLFSKTMNLSRDYPGKLVDRMEGKGYEFAMFLAGAVGSHGCNAPEPDWPCVDWMSDVIATSFDNHPTYVPLHDSTLAMYRVPLELGKAQVKISKDWKVRPWLFKAAFGESPNYLTALRIGELIMLGTPCDYSGELTQPLYDYAKSKNMQLMVTSFNGGYIGYITPEKYYDVDHYETRLMNWYGPGSGEYMQQCLKDISEAVSN